MWSDGSFAMDCSSYMLSNLQIIVYIVPCKEKGIFASRNRRVARFKTVLCNGQIQVKWGG